MQTRLLPTDSPASLAEARIEAARLLGQGEPVALPTETVYGLAASALLPQAVTKIFEAKERPFFDPLICHLPTLDWLDRMAEIPAVSRTLVDELATRFWPGPLTLVLPRRPIVPDLVTSGLETVALRMSAHPVFRAVIEHFGQPLAAPSANRFGRISPTAASHVLTELGGRIPLIVDGGPTLHGIESTIVAVNGGSLRLLRAGPITPEDLAQAWSAARIKCGETPAEAEILAFRESLGVSGNAMLHGKQNAAIEAPGQLPSHYAPRTPLKLLSEGEQYRPSGLHSSRIGALLFQQAPSPGEFAPHEILSAAGDLREAAANLFAKLRRLDEAGLDLIIAESVPETGLGIAIMDRLRKASAKKSSD